MPSFLVVISWGDDRYGVFRFRGYSNDNRFGVVDRFGRWITPEVSGEYTAGTSPLQAAIAWNGSAFGIAWINERQTLDVSRFGPEANELGSSAVFSNEAEVLLHPAIVADGDGFALGWEGVVYVPGEEQSNWRNEVYFARVGPDGAAVGTPTMVHSSPGYEQTAYPALVVTDNGYLVVMSANQGLQIAALDETGSLTQPPFPVDISPACAGGPASPARVADEVGLAWACGEQIWFMRLDQEGQPLTSPVAVVTGSTTTSAPALFWTGSGYTVAFREGVYPSLLPCAERLDPSGTPIGQPACMSTTAGPWGRMSFASTGAETAGVFLQQQNGSSEVYFARFGCSCSDLDEDGVSTCQDCDDASATTFPGAPQACDGRDNDCRRPTWPALPPGEEDQDGDGVLVCAGDCDDRRASIHVGATETCDRRDNDCDGKVDEPPVCRQR